VVGGIPAVSGNQFGGFSITVANPPLLNRVKAGERVSLIWTVTNANGQPATNLNGASLTVESLAYPAGKG